MTNEHKDALTGLCKIEIKRWKVASESNPNMRYMVELMEVALDALTAQPVKLPNKIERDDADGYWMHKSGRVSAVNAAYFNEALSECKEALNAQGYEVQE